MHLSVISNTPKYTIFRITRKVAMHAAVRYKPYQMNLLIKNTKEFIIVCGNRCHWILFKNTIMYQQVRFPFYKAKFSKKRNLFFKEFLTKERYAFFIPKHMAKQNHSFLRISCYIIREYIIYVIYLVTGAIVLSLSFPIDVRKCLKCMCLQKHTCIYQV